MRKSLVILALLVLLAPVVAQEIQTIPFDIDRGEEVEVTSLDQALDALIGFLGQDALEFILAFGIIFALIFMAFNLSDEMRTNDATKAASGVIAALAGFATATYIHMSNINFLAEVCLFLYLLERNSI